MPLLPSSVMLVKVPAVYVSINSCGISIIDASKVPFKNISFVEGVAIMSVLAGLALTVPSESVKDMSGAVKVSPGSIS